jgi:protein-disulfide isomerase
MEQQVIAGRFAVVGPFGAVSGPGRRVRDLTWQSDAVLWDIPQGPQAPATARALAGLRHPGLVPVVDAAEADGRWYVVTHQPSGPSLRDFAASLPLPPWQVTRYGREVLATLRTLHAAGLYAPGLHPGTVFPIPSPASGVALAGFSGPGEAEFTAPERRAGGPDHPAADLWSLGMLLRFLSEGPAAPSTVNNPPPPARPGPLAPVLDALLAADPAERPDAARLDTLLAGVQAQCPPPPPAPPLPPSFVPQVPVWRASTTNIVLTVVLAVLFTMVAAVYVISGATDEDDAPTARDSSLTRSGSGDRGGEGTSPDGMRVPRHASGADGLTIALGEPDAPHTLVMYEEPRCPHCADLETEIGDELDEDVASGTYRVEFVIGTFLDSGPENDGSMNALTALGAALDVSPEAFRDYQRLLYASPSGSFSSDETLLAIAESVPALAGDAEFAGDVTGETFGPWAQEMSWSFLDVPDVTGTPTLRFDGEIIATPDSAAEFRRTIDELTN